jgi:uncharacterized protein YegP (UPF0339 family)
MSKSKKQAGIHLYKVKRYTNKLKAKSQWHWNLVSTNGRIIAKSSENYSSKKNAITSIMIVAKYFNDNQHYYDHTGKDVGLVVYEL